MAATIARDGLADPYRTARFFDGARAARDDMTAPREDEDYEYRHFFGESRYSGSVV